MLGCGGQLHTVARPRSSKTAAKLVASRANPLSCNQWGAESLRGPVSRVAWLGVEQRVAGSVRWGGTVDSELAAPCNAERSAARATDEVT
eukprot:1652883-Pleurochrysis_carterae.AAC.1